MSVVLYFYLNVFFQCGFAAFSENVKVKYFFQHYRFSSTLSFSHKCWVLNEISQESQTRLESSVCRQVNTEAWFSDQWHLIPVSHPPHSKFPPARLMGSKTETDLFFLLITPHIYRYWLIYWCFNYWNTCFFKCPFILFVCMYFEFAWNETVCRLLCGELLFVLTFSSIHNLINLFQSAEWWTKKALESCEKLFFL